MSTFACDVNENNISELIHKFVRFRSNGSRCAHIQCHDYSMLLMCEICNEISLLSRDSRAFRIPVINYHSMAILRLWDRLSPSAALWLRNTGRSNVFRDPKKKIM